MARKTIAVFADSPTVPTGFGQVIKNIFVPLSRKYDIKLFGINYSGYPHDFPFQIWPALNPLLAVSRPGDPYGREHLKMWLQEQHFDMLFLLNDAWIMHEFIPQMLEPLKKAGKPVVAYFPIDCDEYDANWYSWLANVDAAITYTEFGRGVINKICPDVNVRVIPHGADTVTFHPIRRDDDRIQQLKSRIEGDFVWLNVNVNQPRKNLPATIVAMKDYVHATGHWNDKLVLHCKEADNFGYNLPAISKHVFEGQKKRMVLVSTNRIADQDMNCLYAASDCVVTTTHGEGWGLSISEALSTETPIIAPAHTSLPEVAAGFGYLVHPGLKHCALPFQNDRSIFRYFIDPEVMAKAMVDVRQNIDHWKQQARLARKHYADNCQWGKHIVPQWDALFKEFLS